MQLRSLNVGAIIPVSDMDASRAFYEGTLGLDGEPAPGGYALWAGGTTRLFLLDVAAYAGQAGWPLASFQTDDLAATVADLAGRGVQVEIMGDGDLHQDAYHPIEVISNELNYIGFPPPLAEADEAAA